MKSERRSDEIESDRKIQIHLFQVQKERLHLMFLQKQEKILTIMKLEKETSSKEQEEDPGKKEF